MIKGVIFDMDGTLLDTMYFWDKVGDPYLRQLGRDMTSALHGRGGHSVQISHGDAEHQRQCHHRRPHHGHCHKKSS